MKGCTITIPVFEGPLDLLLYLVEKNELDVQAISVAQVAEQYLVYLQHLTELDLDVASEFYLMAVRLLSIKARSLLLPLRRAHRPGQDRGQEDPGGAGAAADDPGAELARELEAYRAMRLRAAALGRMSQDQAQRYGRPSPGAPAGPGPGSGSGPGPEGVALPAQTPPPAALLAAYLAAEARSQGRRPGVIAAEMLTVRVRMAQLLRLLKRSGRLSFSDLALRASGRRDIIVTFLALLELMRRRRVRVEQPEPFADLSLTMPGRASSRQRMAR